MTTQLTKRHRARLLIGALTLFAALLGGASPAYAGLGMAATPDFPQTVSVGQTGVPASLTLQNNSNGTENTAPLTVTDIQLVPSCATTFGGPPDFDCPAAFADPGVFALSATGTGTAG